MFSSTFSRPALQNTHIHTQFLVQCIFSQGGQVRSLMLTTHFPLISINIHNHNHHTCK